MTAPETSDSRPQSAMNRFSETLLEHARRPRKLGRDEEAEFVGRATLDGGAPYVTVYVHVDNGRIVKSSFEAGSCGVTIAACSALTELLAGMEASAAVQVTASDLADVLNGTPDDKRYCLDVALESLRNALHEWDAAKICITGQT